MAVDAANWVQPQRSFVRGGAPPQKVLRDNATADPELLEVSLVMPGIPVQRRV